MPNLTWTQGRNLYGQLTNNSSSTNLSFGDILIGQYTLELVHKFPFIFGEKTFLLQTFPNQQFYTLNVPLRKVNTVVIQVSGSSGFNWPVKECPTMEYWNYLNLTNNIKSDIPQYYFYYNGQLGIYPRPANGYNPMTVRGQVDVTNETQADVVETKNINIPEVLTLTAAPAVGDITATLTSNFDLTSGTYQILFLDANSIVMETILASLTNGSAVVSLSKAIVGTSNYALTLTAKLSVGATTATLTSNFLLPTGTYKITFSDGETINATFTNGSTAITAFASGITGAPNENITINSSTGTNISSLTTTINVRTASGGEIIGVNTGTSLMGKSGYAIQVAQPTGDGFYYTLDVIYASGSASIIGSYQGASISNVSTSYTVGQTSILPPVGQMIPIYRAAQVYYTTVSKDQVRADGYARLADLAEATLKADQGNKDTDPTVQDDFGKQLINPNLTINTTDSSVGS